MDDTRCKYINKTCPHARSVKENGELHRLCTFHRAKAVDAQRRWHSRRRSGVKRRSHSNHDDDVDDGGDTDASSAPAHGHGHGYPYTHAPPVYTQPPPPPSPKRRHVGHTSHAPELPALAEVMMMLRQRRPVADAVAATPPASYERVGETAWPAPSHASQPPRYYEDPHAPPPPSSTAMPAVSVRNQPRYYEENAPRQPYYELERYDHTRYEHERYQQDAYAGYEHGPGRYAHETNANRTPTPPNEHGAVRPLHAYTREYRGDDDERAFVARAHDRSDAAAGRM